VRFVRVRFVRVRFVRFVRVRFVRVRFVRVRFVRLSFFSFFCKKKQSATCCNAQRATAHIARATRIASSVR
jgi:hypothetical protein